MSLFPAYQAAGAEKGTRVRDFVVSTTGGQECIVGDLFFYDTTANNIQRCGADPALIAGVSEVVTNNARLLTPDNKVPLRVIEGFNVLFAFSGSTAAALSHIGDQYGVTRASGGQWQLDTAKTGASARVIVVDVDVTNGIYFCHFLNDQLQFAAIA